MTDDEKAHEVLAILAATPCPLCGKPMREVTYWNQADDKGTTTWYCVGCPKREYQPSYYDD